MYKTIKLDINDNAAIITLSRPDAMNAFNETMAHELLEAFDKVTSNKDVRAILLRGEGKAFCVGGDIQMFADKMDDMPGTVPATMEVLNTLITTIMACNIPVLASVHGSVAGVGMSFVLACDLAIANESTKFTMAYAGIGLTPDGGASYNLPRIVGERRAMQMFLLPEIFAAKEAYEFGIINWLVPDGELDKTTTKLMYKLSNGPGVAYKRVKHLMDTTWKNNLEDQLIEEMHAFTECTVSKDFSRGVDAFLNKQKPVFEGN